MNSAKPSTRPTSTAAAVALERAPADRTGTIGVEAFDATYGAGFQASDDPPHAVECKLVEDGAAFVAHRPPDADRPRRVAFVDGTLRTEARLTRTDADVSMGVGGSLGWASPASRCRQASAAPLRSRRRRGRLAGLPGFASALHRDARAPVNLTPIAGPPTASAPAARGRTPRPARGAGGGARTQPRRTDGMIADRRPPAHRGRQRRRISGPFAHDSHTAALAGGRPGRGSPGVRPPARRAPNSLGRTRRI